MHLTKSIQLAAGLFLIAATANAGPFDLYYQKHIENKNAGLRLWAENSKISTGIFKQLVDHTDPKLGRFSQRYYVDETYSESDQSPVFFHLCGESTCTPNSLNGSLREMAKKYHAKLISLEHRYYGASLPRTTFTTDDLKFLTTDQALQDAAAFQKFFMRNDNWKGKWIVFGGSYPGSLSAYYRLKYPELVAGALASSAPVLAKENFEEYDAHVTQVAGPVCADKMRAAYRQIESVMSDPARMTVIKRSFGVENLRNDTDFLFLVADIGSAAVQYGYKNMFCNMLQQGQDPLTGYAEFAKYFYNAWGIDDPVSLAIQGAESENPADYADGLGMRQWYYQSCIEYGYWKNAHHDPAKSTRSSAVNAAYFHDVCKRLFGITTNANTDLINSQFYRPLLDSTTSRIFFTNGSTDPWSRLSLTPANGNATNKNLAYYTIEGAAHCDDLRQPRDNDSAALKSARQQFS